MTPPAAPPVPGLPAAKGRRGSVSSVRRRIPPRAARVLRLRARAQLRGALHAETRGTPWCGGTPAAPQSAGPHGEGGVAAPARRPSWPGLCQHLTVLGPGCSQGRDAVFDSTCWLTTLQRQPFEAASPRKLPAAENILYVAAGATPGRIISFFGPPLTL